MGALLEKYGAPRTRGDIRSGAKKSLVPAYSKMLMSPAPPWRAT